MPPPNDVNLVASLLHLGVLHLSDIIYYLLILAYPVFFLFIDPGFLNPDPLGIVAILIANLASTFFCF